MKYIRRKRISKIFLITTVFSVSCAGEIYSQTILEGGPMLGVSWYNGDLNPQRQFYNMQPAFGAFVRFIHNDRLAYKGSFLLGGINGEYPTNSVLLREFNDQPYTFNRTISDVALMFEINLFSFNHPYKQGTNFAPYISFGAGTIFYKRFENDEEKPYFVFSFPFGAGVKWKLKNNLRLGIEWTTRKTFADDLDKVGFNNSVQPADPYGFNQWKMSHNNDWVSFVTIYASFTLINKREKCDAGFY
ncbi:MAG: DUF6089 family protein [Marinilabiliaceae bacterium]|nr:DUF6089 family protein [Marinilabiliaceae bacterium]